MSLPPEISRRTLLGTAAGLLAATGTPSRAATNSGGLKVSIFSKHLLFLQGDALARAPPTSAATASTSQSARAAMWNRSRGTGFPKLVKIIRQHGLEVPMITTDIVDADLAACGGMLRTMHELGIRNYRWGGFKYDYAQPMAPQLEAFKPRVAKLAELNIATKTLLPFITRTPATGVVGAPIWDLHIILKDFDPKAVGVNYDIGHATIEGGFGGWIDSFYITGKHLRGIAVKDCVMGGRTQMASGNPSSFPWARAWCISRSSSKW